MKCHCGDAGGMSEHRKTGGWRQRLMHVDDIKSIVADVMREL